MAMLRSYCMYSVAPTCPACQHAWQRQLASNCPCLGAEAWLLCRQKALASKRQYVRALAGPDDRLKGVVWLCC